MTVAELIEKLEQYPPENDVWIEWMEINTVFDEDQRRWDYDIITSD